MSRETDLRTHVAGVVADLLDRDVAGVREHDDLLDLPGFDSVVIVEALERLEDELGVEVPPERIVPEAFASITTLTDLLAGVGRPTTQE